MGRVRVFLIVALGLVGAIAPIESAAASSGLPVVTSITPYRDAVTYSTMSMWTGVPTPPRENAIQRVGGGFSSVNPPPPDLVNYAGFSPASPQSYRAVACQTGCNGTVCDPYGPPTLTLPPGLYGPCAIGPWYHPAVSATIHDPTPTVNVQAHIGFVTGTVNLGTHTDAPVTVIYRDGKPIILLPPGQTAFSDAGPFLNDTVRYRATSCYRDCTPMTMADGFAAEHSGERPDFSDNPDFDRPRHDDDTGCQGIRVPARSNDLNLGSGNHTSACCCAQHITVASDAPAPGLRDITLTNPDGSYQTCSACLFVSPAPQPLSVSPASIPRGYSGTVQLNGTSFEPAATVSTTMPGVTITSVSVVSWTEIAMTITVKGSSPTGPVPLTVTNADHGAGTCTTCLTIS